MFLDAEPEAESLRTRASNRPLVGLAIFAVVLPLGFGLAALPEPPDERWSLAPTFGTIFAIAMASFVFIHFYIGYFVISPKDAEVRSSRHPTPFSELKLPRVVAVTNKERYGEFTEHEWEEEGFALRCGHHGFFRGARKSREQIGRIASALNEALREYDEREATREWLKQRELER